MKEQLAKLWPDVERILDEVLDLPEPLRSTRALAACAGDAALEHAVRQVLRADSLVGDFLGTPVTILPEEEGEVEPETLVPRIGPFRIVREIGRGGMGAVLLGERDDGEFEQRVAIKLLHRSFAGSDARETLVRERRILARLEHPAIGRMYDGGITAQGDPYFIMEYVEGAQLDRYCDEHRLGIDDRLRLFRRVCEAVEYAHGRLVVHCDLKPGNILVTPSGEVKLVDFGIARLLEEEGRGGARDGERMLTPAYAAPEQSRGEAVTAATDVYQLGAVLYELLAGRRVALPVQPPSRAATDARLSKRLAGDLDAIVLQALREDPAARYPTAESLRRDLEDHAASRPVSARGGSSAYRVGKYLARHRVGMVAAAAIVVAVVAGMVGVAAQSRVAAGERDRARLAEGRASAVKDYLLYELLRAPMPETSMGRDLTVAEVLGNAARSVGHAFEGQPATEAEVRLALARTYAALGRTAEAAVHAQAGYDLVRGDPAASPEDLSSAERTLAEIRIDEGRYAEALRMLEALGASDTDTLATAAALGRALLGLGEYARAKALLGEALEVAKRDPAQWRISVKIARHLANALNIRQEGVEAERVVRGMLATIKTHLGPDHTERIEGLTDLASALTAQLRYAEAAEVTEEAVALSRAVFGSDHPAVATARYAQGRAYERLSRYDDAEAAVTDALAIARRSLGSEHPRTMFYLHQLALLTANSGRLREAEAQLREVVDVSARTIGESNAATIGALRSLLGVVEESGRKDETRSIAERTLRAYEAAVEDPAADPGLVDQYAAFLLGVSPASLRDPARALALAERAVASTDRKLYPALSTLADALVAAGRPRDAIATLREALELPEGARSWSMEERVVDLLGKTATSREVESFLSERIARQRARQDADERMLAKSERLLGLHLQAEGRLPEAERALTDALERLRRVVPVGNWEIGRTQSELGGCIAERGEHARAEPLLLEAHRILEADPQARRAQRASRERLARFYEISGRPAEAERWR